MEKQEDPSGNIQPDPDVVRFLFQMMQSQVEPNQLQTLVQKLNNPEAQRNEHEASYGASEHSKGEAGVSTTSEKFSYLPRPFKNLTSSEGSIDAKATEFQSFQEGQRSELIRLKPVKTEIQPSAASESEKDSAYLTPLRLTAKTANWCGSSIYNNLPEAAMFEFDKILKEGHKQKVEVIKALNMENPVTYEYNPKKSRTRCSFVETFRAEDRTKNNVASRRSRQRKKFATQMGQYSVDFDVDDNYLYIKQDGWIGGLIGNLENRALAKGVSVENIRIIRAQCGLE